MLLNQTDNGHSLGRGRGVLSLLSSPEVKKATFVRKESNSELSTLKLVVVHATRLVDRMVDCRMCP